MTDFCYDCESFPNVWTCVIERADTDDWWAFEISNRRNDLGAFVSFINALREWRARMVGFNNFGFDYPVIHEMLMNPSAVTPLTIYNKVQAIISAGDDAKFSHIIWDKDQVVQQMDLMKIHHFDNKARMTSLKQIEFNMRMQNVQDLPFKPGTFIRDDQIDTLIQYNRHDVKATKRFYNVSKEAIAFREELTEKYGINMMNFNDTKIGKKYFAMRLEQAMPGSCYHPGPGNRPKQTIRESIDLSTVILPYVQFEQPEFNRILNFFRSQTITETKGVFEKLHATVNGFRFDFGVGGIHGSVSSRTVTSDEHYVLFDFDVKSYYPHLAIANRLYPAHLGEQFCDIYKEVYDLRTNYPKGSAINLLFKLALNGVYGDSNNKYSCFYDPAYTMAITINGQLLLCMLAEQMMKIPGLEIIQANTDGITVRAPRVQIDNLKLVCKWWESVTKLELEDVEYSHMWIRDVNSYVARTTKGKLKRKGAYEWVTTEDGGTLGWHQDHSALIIPMAAEAALVRGESVRDFILNHDELFDFMLRAKVPKTSRLTLQQDGVVTDLQKITRFYVSKSGGKLVKIMPPLAKKPGVDRPIGICVDSLCREANDISSVRELDIDMEYYIREAEKLVVPLRRAA